MFVLQSSDGNFYSGRAGQLWLTPSKAEAFTYSDRANADWKSQVFNRATCLHGLTFKSVER